MGWAFLILMKATLYIYRLFNYLSFDVACGAMVCATFFAHILHVQMLPYGLASLGLTVWIIYTIDHLLDVRKLKREASSKRHRFHQKNFWTLLTFLIIAILIDLSLILLIRKPILIWGIGLALVVVLYLCFQQRLILFKELVVSLLYASGILLPAMSLTRMVLSVDEIILISFFTLTAFINLILFSWYDWKQDIRDNHPSLVTFFGRKEVKKFLVILFLLQTAFSADLILVSSYRIEALILVMMNLPLLILFLFPEKFMRGDFYRLIGDAVFLLPLPYVLVNG